MPTVSLTLHQTAVPATVSGGATYTVTNEITASVGISPAVFVFKTDTGVFDHYATPPDMEALPASQAEAVAAGLPFYRQPGVTRVWTTISAMEEDLALTQTRLNGLVRETSQIQGSLTIDRSVVLQAV